MLRAVTVLKRVYWGRTIRMKRGSRLMQLFMTCLQIKKKCAAQRREMTAKVKKNRNNLIYVRQSILFKIFTFPLSQPSSCPQLALVFLHSLPMLGQISLKFVSGMSCLVRLLPWVGLKLVKLSCPVRETIYFHTSFSALQEYHVFCWATTGISFIFVT